MRAQLASEHLRVQVGTMGAKGAESSLGGVALRSVFNIVNNVNDVSAFPLPACKRPIQQIECDGIVGDHAPDEGDVGAETLGRQSGSQSWRSSILNMNSRQVGWMPRRVTGSSG